METDKKIRSAVNYYRRNTLKKYFHIWMKYITGRKKYLKNNVIGEQRNRGSFDSKSRILRFDSSTLVSTTVDVDNIVNEQKKKQIEPERAVKVLLVSSTDIADLNKTINDEINKQTVRLWFLLLNRIFKLWKKYSYFVLNKNHGRTLVMNVKRLQYSRKNIIIVHRAFVLLKTAWEIWYLHCTNKSNL